MTHDLNRLAYMNGAPVEKQYVFPYAECYYGTRLQVECLYEWKQKHIEAFETFKRNVLGHEIPLQVQTGNREIRCIEQGHMDFFMEQRKTIRGEIAYHGINCETTSGNRTEHDRSVWKVESIGVAGHCRLYAKLKR